MESLLYRIKAWWHRWRGQRRQARLIRRANKQTKQSLDEKGFYRVPGEVKEEAYGPGEDELSIYGRGDDGQPQKDRKYPPLDKDRRDLMRELVFEAIEKDRVKSREEKERQLEDQEADDSSKEAG